LIRKFHPRLRDLAQGQEQADVQIGSEEDMKELWDASNPDMEHEMRSDNEWSYPVDNWFGTIVQEGDKSRLVSVIGHAVREGKENQPYAYFGGAKTHPDYRGRGLMRGIREKALQGISGMPRIAGFSNMRRKSGLTLDKPETHEIIPDDVLAFMDERIKHLDNVDDWGVAKWMQVLRRHD
tara:strand:- start:165 stop:704 length:540 start_codon:yes stop_codon:yes gene_type:complete